jgi:flagellar motor switch protein FliN
MAEATDEDKAPAVEGEESPQDVEVRDAELQEVAQQRVPGGTGQIDILLDTMMKVSVGLGETTLPVRDLLQMGPGSVLKLDRAVGEPVDLYLRGMQFAKGRLVVVGDQLGVRITEVLPPAEEEE